MPMSRPSEKYADPDTRPAWLAACALLAMLSAGCSTFSPSTSFEPEYYVDEYGMVHVPERDQRSGAYQLRPGYGMFDPLVDPLYSQGYGPVYGQGYDPFNRFSYYRHPFYAGPAFGFGYYRAPIYEQPPAQVGTPAPADDAYPRGGIQRTPVSSPVNILRSAPEPFPGSGNARATDPRWQRPASRPRPAYRDGPRAGEPRVVSPARPARRASPPRRAPPRQPPPPSEPRVIDP